MHAHAMPGRAGALALSTLDVFLLTALAKLGATLVTYPMLLVKSRLQVLRAVHRLLRALPACLWLLPCCLPCCLA